MVTLDLFTDAVSRVSSLQLLQIYERYLQSLKVKSGYIDQLRDLDLVGARLLPVIFGILDLYGGIAKAFKLEIWDVDEFYLDRE